MKMSAAFFYSKLHRYPRCLSYTRLLENLRLLHQNPSRVKVGERFSRLYPNTRHMVTIPAENLCTDHFRVELQTEKRLNAVWQAGSDGLKGDSSCLFHAVWLRYNCQCSQCIPSSGQRTSPVEASDPSLKLTSAKVSGMSLLVVFEDCEILEVM